MNDILVTVILPCYNYAHYIVDAINSIKRQTFDKWECIIVNDGSTDNSEEVIKKEIDGDDRFKYVYQQNQGLSATRNNGIRMAKGKYVLSVDADDIINKHYLERGVNYLEKHNECALYYGKAYFLYDDFSLELWNLPKIEEYRYFLFSNFIYSTAMFRKKDFERVGGYDTKMDCYEDWEFYIRLLYDNFNVYKDDNTTVLYYRRHKGSMDEKAQSKCQEMRNYILSKNYFLLKNYF